MPYKMSTSAVGAALVALSACGGGTTSTTETIIQMPTDFDTAPVAATGSDDIDAPATFPLYYTLNEPGDTQATLQTGVGEIVVIDASTVTIALQPGDTPATLTDIGDDQYQGVVDGETIIVDFLKGSRTVLGFIDADPNDFGFTGIFGFETVETDLPLGVAVYDNAGLARAYVATTDDPDPLQVFQDGATNPSLTVDFDSGVVTGTLFDGDALIDLADDGTDDDRLNLRVDIANGSIASGTVSGEVTLTATVDITGADSVDLDPNVTSSSVDARVFGATANVVGGTFEAIADFDTGDAERLDGVVGGTFFTVD